MTDSDNKAPVILTLVSLLLQEDDDEHGPDNKQSYDTQSLPDRGTSNPRKPSKYSSHEPERVSKLREEQVHR